MTNGMIKRIAEFREEIDNLRDRLDELDTDLFQYVLGLPDDVEPHVCDEATDARSYILGALDALKEAHDDLTGALT